MTEEAKRCVVALRTKCREEGSCDVCGKNSFCHVHGDEELSDLAADLIESLSAELEQVKRERDAAVEDLRKVCLATEVCFCCKSRNTDYTEYVSNDCMDCIKHCNWQWRGVKEG